MSKNIFKQFVSLPVATQIALCLLVALVLVLIMTVPGAATSLFNLAVGIKMLTGK